jgi:hypothetical protein
MMTRWLNHWVLGLLMAALGLVPSAAMAGGASKTQPRAVPAAHLSRVGSVQVQHKSASAKHGHKRHKHHKNHKHSGSAHAARKTGGASHAKALRQS